MPLSLGDLGRWSDKFDIAQPVFNVGERDCQCLVVDGFRGAFSGIIIRLLSSKSGSEKDLLAVGGRAGSWARLCWGWL